MIWKERGGGGGEEVNKLECGTTLPGGRILSKGNRILTAELGRIWTHDWEV